MLKKCAIKLFRFSVFMFGFSLFRFFSWWDYALNKRRYKYYSNKNYGEKRARRKATADQQKMLAEKTVSETTTANNNTEKNNGGAHELQNPTSQKVNYNKRTGMLIV